MIKEYDIQYDGGEVKFSNYSLITQYQVDVSENDLTVTGVHSKSLRYESTLCVELDIFDRLPSDIIRSKPRVSRFLDKMRTYIVDNSNYLSELHYNKLSIEQSPNSNELMVDWIYNYFRVFFSFDDNEGDMYGLIENNPQTKIFRSEFLPFNESIYDEVVAKSVKFVTENLIR